MKTAFNVVTAKSRFRRQKETAAMLVRGLVGTAVGWAAMGAAHAATPATAPGEFISPYWTTLVATGFLFCVAAGVLRALSWRSLEWVVGGLALLVVAGTPFADYALGASATVFNAEAATAKGFMLSGLGLITYFGVALVLQLFMGERIEWPTESRAPAESVRVDPPPVPAVGELVHVPAEVESASQRRDEDRGDATPAGHRKIVL